MHNVTVTHGVHSLSACQPHPTSRQGREHEYYFPSADRCKKIIRLKLEIFLLDRMHDDDDYDDNDDDDQFVQRSNTLTFHLLLSELSSRVSASPSMNFI